MNLDWQTVVAGAIVALAVAYLARRAWRALAARRAGCGACPSCPSTEGPQVVSLDASIKSTSARE